MKKIYIPAIGFLMAVMASFMIMGQWCEVLQGNSIRPLFRCLYAGVVVVWLVLAAGIYPVWFRFRSVSLRALHIGFALATLLMVLLYRLALYRGFAGIPYPMCDDWCDAGGRRWDIGAVATNYFIWALVFSIVVAVILKVAWKPQQFAPPLPRAPQPGHSEGER